MPANRRHRIIRRAVMVLAVVVLLPAAYLASAKCTRTLIAFERGWLSGTTKEVGLLYVRPLCEYADAGDGWPGSEWSFELIIWSPDADTDPEE